MILKERSRKTIPNMEINAIDQIIKNGICICGTHLKSEHINTLEHQKNISHLLVTKV